MSTPVLYNADPVFQDIGFPTVKSNALLLPLSQDFLIRAVSFSPDGKYFALAVATHAYTGNVVMTEPWGTILVYTLDNVLFRSTVMMHPVHSLAWHPRRPRCLVVGSAFSQVHLITYHEYHQARDVLDRKSMIMTFQLGAVKILAISKDGQTLAVALGSQVVIIHGDPFAVSWELECRSVLPLPEGHSSIRALHFEDNNTVIVTFESGPAVIIAYSIIHGGQEKWRIPLRRPGLIGTSAISPDGQLIAIANTYDGVDWYSLRRKRYMSTTLCATTQSWQGIAFTGNATVLVGSQDGLVFMADFGMRENPYEIRIAQRGIDIRSMVVLFRPNGVKIAAVGTLEAQTALGASRRIFSPYLVNFCELPARGPRKTVALCRLFITWVLFATMVVMTSYLCDSISPDSLLSAIRSKFQSPNGLDMTVVPAAGLSMEMANPRAFGLLDSVATSTCAAELL
ncbi:hypothetical protein BDN72DRAFT_963876 [Pluteus cervinus]|uniref:Uncharacterized protein n=1 Tax=Pluteus cervinus TaxID=181527 RepID=A0ACD3AD39_9AGAR|nr:hypothetical protein BDN72DRAFT_963876 [Pluteus cervinus]